MGLETFLLDVIIFVNIYRFNEQNNETIGILIY